LFLKRIRALPFSELTHRPLFLTQLIILFDNTGDLPKQPYEIYRMITLLSIREWDQERRIYRKSAYADFQPERKLEFLSRLAFELTCQTKTTQFNHSYLLSAYKKIRNHFSLPEGEEKQVAEEIESHTGIIVEAGYGNYEFSHLTIQEYLCAYYMVRSPFPERVITRYIKEYPAPLAIATALSSQPDVWLSSIVLNPRLFHVVSVNEMVVFLERLKIETPSFVETGVLGLCFMALGFYASEQTTYKEKKSVIFYLDKLIMTDAVKKSLCDVLLNYQVVDDPDLSIYRMRLMSHDKIDEHSLFSESYNIKAPLEGRIDRKWINDIAQDNRLTFNGTNFTRISMT